MEIVVDSMEPLVAQAIPGIRVTPKCAAEWRFERDSGTLQQVNA